MTYLIYIVGLVMISVSHCSTSAVDEKATQEHPKLPSTRGFLPASDCEADLFLGLPDDFKKRNLFLPFALEVFQNGLNDTSDFFSKEDKKAFRFFVVSATSLLKSRLSDHKETWPETPFILNSDQQLDNLFYLLENPKYARFIPILSHRLCITCTDTDKLGKVIIRMPWVSIITFDNCDFSDNLDGHESLINTIRGLEKLEAVYAKIAGNGDAIFYGRLVSAILGKRALTSSASIQLVRGE